MTLRPWMVGARIRTAKTTVSSTMDAAAAMFSELALPRIAIATSPSHDSRQPLLSPVVSWPTTRATSDCPRRYPPRWASIL